MTLIAERDGVYTVTKSNRNKDAEGGRDLDYYTNLWGDFKTKLPVPTVMPYGDKFVIRADLTPGGLKAYAAEKMIADCEEDTLVYCAPRQGHAPDAIAQLAKLYGKKVVFFLPAAKTMSDHQMALLKYPHVSLKFYRIAAMPVLNKYAKEYAEANGYRYIPLGFKDTPSVTAGLINVALECHSQMPAAPTAIYCAVSTGTMIRALQIAWPNAKAYGVAVARNIQDGEKGYAVIESADRVFLSKDPIAKEMRFPTTAAYDAKAWKLFLGGGPGSVFMNVGSDEHITAGLDQITNIPVSYREWGDMNG